MLLYIDELMNSLLLVNFYVLVKLKEKKKKLLEVKLIWYYADVIV